MIYKNGKEVTAVSLGTIAMQAIYHGAVLVWQAISSCFGGGYWSGANAWSNTDGWKNQ